MNALTPYAKMLEMIDTMTHECLSLAQQNKGSAREEFLDRAAAYAHLADHLRAGRSLGEVLRRYCA
jgi:hypothetical protein